MADESDTESFKSAHDGPEASLSSTEPNDSPRFTAEEEAELVTQSNAQKTLGNGFFAKADFSTAIQTYEKGLAACPHYLDFEIAVLKSNIAACHLKLREWMEAVESATSAVDALERVDPIAGKGVNGEADSVAGTGAEPIIEEVDDETAEKIEALAKSGRSREEVQRIRGKALMRRAKGREELGGWSNLSGAEEDYKYLVSTTTLSSMDRKTVEKALQILPPRLEAAKQKEMGEMMGKLKNLGNGILKPFGLSTDNFQFIKDEKTGGYSMNFDQGAGGEDRG